MRSQLIARLRRLRPGDLIACFGLLLIFMLWIATQSFHITRDGLERSEPSALIGDEPHYLLVINSLIFDGDLALTDNHARALRGGWDAGRLWRRRPLAHHTILVDPETRAHALWLDRCRWDRFDRCWPQDLSMTDTLLDHDFPYTRSAIERSSHPVLSAMIIAAALAPFRPDGVDVERRIAILMALIGWAGSILTFRVARALGLSTASALMASMLLALASPWLAYTRSFYPATIAGVGLIFALLCVLRQRLALAALGVSLAAAIKPAISLVAICWIGFQLFQRKWSEAARLSVGVGVCGAAIGAFNYWMAGTPLVFGAITPRTFVNTDSAIFNSLFVPEYGLFFFVPWAMVVFVYLFRLRPLPRRDEMNPAHWITIALIPMVVLFALFPAVGENCYGPRYWVPFLPWMAVAGAAAITSAARVTRIGTIALVLMGALIAIPGALLYPSVWDQPPQTGLVFLVQQLIR